MNPPKQLLGLCSAASVAMVTGLSAQALEASFFGEDLGPGEGPPGLVSHPNADAARADFFSYLIGVGTETFEGFPTGTGAPLAVSFGAAGTATLGGGGSVQSGHDGIGRYPISGTQWWGNSSGFTIDFSDPVAAFGFYGVDIGDFGGRVTLTLLSGLSYDVIIPNTINGAGGSVLYFGYINTDNPFTKATFGNTAPGTDFFGFDDFSIGSIEQVNPNPIPEASTYVGALGVAALAGLQYWRNRRKTA